MEARPPGTTLFANGQAYPATPALAQRLCAERDLHFDAVPSAPRRLLLALVNEGHFVVHKPRRR